MPALLGAQKGLFALLNWLSEAQAIQLCANTARVMDEVCPQVTWAKNICNEGVMQHLSEKKPTKWHNVGVAEKGSVPDILWFQSFYPNIDAVVLLLNDFPDI